MDFLFFIQIFVRQITFIYKYDIVSWHSFVGKDIFYIFYKLQTLYLTFQFFSNFSFNTVFKRFCKF